MAEKFSFAPVVNKVNFDKALEKIRSFVDPPHHSRCAHNVREGLHEVGIEVAHSAFAKDYGPKLIAAGFLPAVNQIDHFQKGDVVIIQGFVIPPLMDLVSPNSCVASGWKQTDKSHAFGHMAMYDGENWIYAKHSINVEDNVIPGSPNSVYDEVFKKGGTSYKVYRYSGPPMPSEADRENSAGERYERQVSAGTEYA